MRDLLTGRLRALTQSPDGLLHDAQPPASIGVAAAQIGADGRPLVEPGAFFCDGNYSLAVNSWNSQAGVAVTLRLRWLSADGRMTDSEFVHAPNTNRTKATSLFPLGVGFALNVTVFASTGSPLIGQTFVQVQIVRGLTGALLPVATILQDYVTSMQALAWPGSPIRSSIEGGGVTRYISGTQPAAGAQINELVPTGARWELLLFAVVLRNSAVVANRATSLRLTDGTNDLLVSPQPHVMHANDIIAFTWGQGMPITIEIQPTREVAGLPFNVPLLAGSAIASAVDGMDVGDRFDAPHYTVRETLEAA